MKVSFTSKIIFCIVLLILSNTFLYLYIKPKLHLVHNSQYIVYFDNMSNVSQDFISNQTKSNVSTYYNLSKVTFYNYLISFNQSFNSLLIDELTSFNQKPDFDILKQSFVGIKNSNEIIHVKVLRKDDGEEYLNYLNKLVESLKPIALQRHLNEFYIEQNELKIKKEEILKAINIVNKSNSDDRVYQKIQDYVISHLLDFLDSQEGTMPTANFYSLIDKTILLQTIDKIDNDLNNINKLIDEMNTIISNNIKLHSNTDIYKNDGKALVYFLIMNLVLFLLVFLYLFLDKILLITKSINKIES